jgi:2-keto-4-pentenoate hydratase/2-oxohepta-3-ene-1,7-dioic acid hydratase in catechol pathway
MRVVSVRKDGLFWLGVLQGEKVLHLADLAREAGNSAPFLASMALFLEAGREAQELVAKLLGNSSGESQGQFITSVELGPPVPRPSKIVAVGLNYKDHVGEGDFQLPECPLIFAKFPNSISGSQDEIVLPSDEMQVDSEAELGVVIGRRAKAINAEAAYEYVAGYMALNDVSARKWQFADKQWTRGKSCDTFCPTGPWLATRDEIPDPHNLRITGRLNSQVLQESNTCHLIFRIPELLSYISASITLEPGDIIATGTPSGVGAFRKPPIFMKEGDVAEIEIEKLGLQRNRVRVSAHS